MNPDAPLGFEDARSRLHEDAWFPRAPEVLKVGLVPTMQRIVFEHLASRTWSLGRAAGSGGFICSDTPLVWGSADPGGRDASLADPSVDITFPLSKDLALITRDDRQGTYEAVDFVVAWVNTRTLFASLGMLYFATDDFLLLRGDGSMWHGVDYFAYIEHARRGGIPTP